MTRAGYTVASGFTLLYVVTACCADNDSTPIPCRPLSHSGAVTPVLATAFAPHAFLNLTMNQFDARQRYVEDLVGPPTFLIPSRQENDFVRAATIYLFIALNTLHQRHFT